MTSDEMTLLLHKVLVHIKSHNQPSKAVDRIIKKVEFLKNMIAKKDVQHLEQLIAYVLYVSEIDIADNRGLQ